MELVQISKGNSKTGRMPAISFHPKLTCGPWLPCWDGGCYARACCNYLPQADVAWARNYRVYKRNPQAFFDFIIERLRRNKSRYARWFVGGDIPDERFLAGMKEVALALPDKRFLAFTKRHGRKSVGKKRGQIYRPIKLGKLPSNLSILHSFWPKWGDEGAKRVVPRSWVVNPDIPDPRIPDDAIECSGGCERCGMCWDLKNIGRDVKIPFHGPKARKGKSKKH